MMNHLSIVILAAGNGKRMHSKLPKVLHPLAGVPMLQRVVNTAEAMQPDQIMVVYGNHGTIPKALPNLDVQWVCQKTPLGTAHAVSQALPYIEETQKVLILYGDVPLISKETLEYLIQSTPQDALGLIVTRLNNPHGFGRIIRDEFHHIVRIVEEKDTTESEKAIQEINTGILLVPAACLKKYLPRIENQNAQKEYYLTDIVAQAKADNHAVHGVVALSSDEVCGVNTLKELVELERIHQYQMACQYLEKGILIKDPKRFDLRGQLKANAGVIIDVDTVLEGDVVLGENSVIGPHVCLKNVTIGEGVEIKPYTVIEDAVIESGCVVGPFARIRPGTRLAKQVKIGNFVEIKHSEIGEGSKAGHLSYLGDAVIAENVNIGAGVITCNYDGVNKHKTQIKAGAFIGSDVQLVAPVTVHANAVVGAGSTITADVPKNSLVVARARQVVVGDQDKKVRQLKGKGIQK